MKHIYLAGPIAGCSYGEAVDWRVEFGSSLPPGVASVSPMRAKEFLRRRRKISGPYADQLSSSTSAIGCRDYYDVTHCDMIVAYLPKAIGDRRPSIGTFMELGVAHAHNVPTIIVTDDPHISEHPLANDWTGWIVGSFDEALEVLGFVLEPYLEETE